MDRGDWFEKDDGLEGRIVNVLRILGGPLLVTIDKAGFKLAEVLEGLLAVLN